MGFTATVDVLSGSRDSSSASQFAVVVSLAVRMTSLERCYFPWFSDTTMRGKHAAQRTSYRLRVWVAYIVDAITPTLNQRQSDKLGTRTVHSLFDCRPDVC